MIDGTEELKRENKLLEQLESMTVSEPLISPFNPNLQDPLLYMGRWLNNKDLSSYSRSCHQTAQWTKQDMEFRAASTLLDLVVKGNEDGAMRLLQGNPGLLLDLLLNNKCSAIDYSGKTITGLTAFQAALCAGDVEMCLMMKECVNTVENGPELLKQQYDTIFPKGIEAYSQEQAKTTFDFSEIINAILNALDDEVVEALSKQFDESKPLHKSLNSFRAAFDKLSFNTDIFNPWHLHKAFTLYNDNFDAMQSWNKRDLLWRQVVGYTQRHVPACYAQALAQGVYYLVEEKEPLRRRFNFRFGRGAMFPTRSFVDLGFDFAAPGTRGGLGGSGDFGSGPVLEKFFRAKTSNLDRSFSARRETTTLGV